MPVTMNDRTYHKTGEVCRIAGISKSTLFRWLKEGVVKDAEHRDRRGWRLFTEEDIDKIKAETRRMEVNRM